MMLIALVVSAANYFVNVSMAVVGAAFAIALALSSTYLVYHHLQLGDDDDF